ncbi:sugar kinase [Bacillus sp. FJAT-27225]|uniref:sugar kinase n=1 Tax=Bacillus sp. FJAT-27225 TaxID=1743144 RepID=UPI000AEB7EF7|nr:sugar kinase [Bacillus sp. FJAT-27225]
MKKVVTMGEIMLRLSTPGHERFNQAQIFDVHYGGGEANVAIGLSQLGVNSSFVSKLPDNALGTSAAEFLNRYGVETEHMLFGGERIGIYFLEKGYSIRPSKIIYDRSGSAFAESKTSEYDFAKIFEDADWFHISGISPALNEEVFQLTRRALSTAKQLGVTTSCDLNYRSSLWSFEEARWKMTELMKDVDVCIGVEPLQLLDGEGKDLKDQLLPEQPGPEDYKEIMKIMHERFGVHYIAMTYRNQLSVNRHCLKALLSDGTEFYQSSEIDVDIVDRVGTGDAFSTGLIYSLLNQTEPQAAVDFATACFALKHTVEGDANLLSFSEVEQFVKHKNSFSIKR